MDQSTNYKRKIELNDTPLIQPTKEIKKHKKCKTRIRCGECNKSRTRLDESHQICHVCYKTKTLYNPKPSGSKIIDEMINRSQGLVSCD
jgi:hypothetical protein